MINYVPHCVYPNTLPKEFTADVERETEARVLRRFHELNLAGVFDKKTEEKQYDTFARLYSKVAREVVKERKGAKR